MALEWMSGFDHMTEAQLSLGLFTTNNGADVSPIYARTGSRSLSIASTIGNCFRLGLSNAATRIIGFGLLQTDVSIANGRIIFAFGDGTPVTDGNAQVSMGLNADGSISIYSGRGLNANSGGNLLGTSGTGIFPSSLQWYYVEIVATFHGSTGAVQVFVNNVSILTLTNQDTTATANAYANAFGFGAQSSPGILYFDDVYVLSGTGGVRTTRLGAVRVVGLAAAAGDGSVAQFTPSSGSDNGAMVDETPTPDGDSTYNESGTVGLIDTYNFAAIGLTGTVLGLQVKNYAKVDSGAASVRAVQRIGSTNYFNSVVALTTGYGYGPLEISEQSPATATNYTVAEIDAAEFGIEHNA